MEELAQLIPWSGQAIRTMMPPGILREGVHYFHVRRRPIFKWEAIVAFTGREQCPDRRERSLPEGAPGVSLLG